MVILSINGAELDPDLWKLKARTVFRGDSVRVISLTLRVYVDDLTLAGSVEVHPAFWLCLSKRVELEPFAPLARVFGRMGRPVGFEDKPALSLDTADFSRHCVELCISIAGRDAKLASTPHLDEGSLPVCDNQFRGHLASSAARKVMKCLWLARSDIMVAVRLRSCSERRPILCHPFLVKHVLPSFAKAFRQNCSIS